jgi:cyclopropane fatty-acyl-phospholipid synthase-like methyltransferase
MTRFGADSHAFFSGVYGDVPPWDIGGAQPDMAALIAEVPPTGPVLDVGCGSGDLAIHLAHSGLEAVGIDFVATAIEHALQKRAGLPAEIANRLEFAVADATRPSLLKRDFGAVVDSGFLHVLAPEQTDAFIDEIAAVLRPGGLLYLHEFAIEFPVPNTPRQVTEDEVRTRFTPERGWRIRVLRSGGFQNRVAAPVPATLACIERTSRG